MPYAYYSVFPFISNGGDNAVYVNLRCLPGIFSLSSELYLAKNPLELDSRSEMNSKRAVSPLNVSLCSPLPVNLRRLCVEVSLCEYTKKSPVRPSVSLSSIVTKMLLAFGIWITHRQTTSLGNRRG